MKTTYYPAGVCSRQYDIELDDGVIKAVEITGGCNGNLSGIRALISGKRADEVIPLLRGIQCGNKATSCPDQISYALEQALSEEKERLNCAKDYSSCAKLDMNKEFLFANYHYLRAENSSFGVESAEQVNITSITLDELIYLLNTDGTHMILFGGIWSSETQSVIDQINYYARAHGVDTVYLFDFYADGEDPSSSFKADLTQQADYDGPGKREVVGCAVCNYLYGELVTRHLTNLNDWVAAKAGSENDITFLNVYCDAVRVPNLQEPFLFLYNKYNTVDNSGCGVVSESGRYPIIAAMELNYHRRSDGVLCDAKGKAVGDLGELLEQGIFQYVGQNGCTITPYTHADYMFDAFNLNTRGHSAKSEPAFQKGEQINIQPVTLTQLLWMFRQKGTFVFMIGGPWCANSQAAVATLNDYAVANDARVYMFDMRLDSKYAVDFWDYPRQNEYKISSPYLMHRYVEIWEKYLPNAHVLCNINPHGPVWSRPTPVINYTDAEGKEHHVLSVGVPFIFTYNKDHTTRRGGIAPIVASHHDSGELINCTPEYIYHAPNYQKFKGGVYSVMYAFAEGVGQTMKDITIDRTAPIVPGTPGINPNIAGKVKYHKEHNWWKERLDPEAAAAKANEAAATAVEEAQGCC